MDNHALAVQAAMDDEGGTHSSLTDCQLYRWLTVPPSEGIFMPSTHPAYCALQRQLCLQKDLDLQCYSLWVSLPLATVYVTSLAGATLILVSVVDSCSIAESHGAHSVPEEWSCCCTAQLLHEIGTHLKAAGSIVTTAALNT